MFGSLTTHRQLSCRHLDLMLQRRVEVQREVQGLRLVGLQTYHNDIIGQRSKRPTGIGHPIRLKAGHGHRLLDVQFSIIVLALRRFGMLYEKRA